MKRWLLIGLICTSVGAWANVDSTRIEFTDRESQVRVAVHLPQDVDQLPNGLSVWKLLVKVGVEEAQKGGLEKFLSAKIVGSQYLVPLPPKDTIRVEILGELDEKTGKFGITFQRSDKPEQPKRFFPKRDFGLYLGINNWHGPNTILRESELRWPQSIYVGLSFRRNMEIWKSDQVAFGFSYAPEIVWHNFRFKPAAVVRENALGDPYFESINEDIKKSKLTVPQFSVPFMFHVGIPKTKWTFAIGPYASIRLGGHTKIKYGGWDGKEKERGDFGMRPWQTGWMAEVGRRSGMKLFFRQDNQTLFRAADRPEKVWAMGVRF